MNIAAAPRSEELAKRALDSHDGVTAKYARILLSYSRNREIEKVVQETGWTAGTVDRVLRKYEQQGDSILHPRPGPRKPLVENFLFSTYEGAEWTYYKGASFHSSLELNRRVIEQVQRLLPCDCDRRILEVGPGEGAMAMMLRDAGYKIECVDVGDYEFLPSDIPLRFMDADKGLAHSLHGQQYDLILALEVIEHLRHPWKLVEDAFALLKPGGWFIITTPNIANFVSRAFFLTDGEFLLFPKPRNDIGLHDHITPFPWYIIEYIFTTVGFEDVTTKDVNRLSIICLQSYRHILRSFVRLLSYLTAVLSFRSRRTPLFGKQIIVVGKKPNDCPDIPPASRHQPA